MARDSGHAAMVGTLQAGSDQRPDGRCLTVGGASLHGAMCRVLITGATSTLHSAGPSLCEHHDSSKFLVQ